MVVVIVDARVFVLEAKKASKKFQSSQLFDDDDGGDVNHDVDYDFGEDDDDLDDNDNNDDYVSIMMTWCWCHPHKLLHTHPRSQRGCDLVENVVIVVLVLLQNIIIVAAIIAMIHYDTL